MLKLVTNAVSPLGDNVIFIASAEVPKEEIMAGLDGLLTSMIWTPLLPAATNAIVPSADRETSDV